MIQVRSASERGRTQIDWLDSRHTFSFGEYYDPQHMGFRSLRVINDDRVAPDRGFGTHAHRDMEIITYVLEGELQHKDSLGNGSVIVPGDVQRMSAGTGIQHSEFNPAPATPVHFLQIWILPKQGGLQPSYEQRSLKDESLRAGLRLIAASDGREEAVTVHQDVDVYATRLQAGEQIVHNLRPNRHAWVHIARGSVQLNGHKLSEGDGAAITAERVIEIKALQAAEILLFDLA